MPMALFCTWIVVFALSETLRQSNAHTLRNRVPQVPFRYCQNEATSLSCLLFALSTPLRPLPNRILAFGDSLTAGQVSQKRYLPYGDVVATAFQGRAEVVSSGVVLESSFAMPERLRNELARGNYDVVIAFGGTNDLWRGDADKIWQNLQNIYSQVDDHGACLGVVTLPPFDPDIMKWLKFTGILETTDAARVDINNRIRDEVTRRRMDHRPCFLVDVALLSEDEALSEIMRRPDGIHFSASGYERIGLQAAQVIRDFYGEDVAAD